MRIAQVAPLFESVPRRADGGTERVVSWLTEELVRQGHEVTLFASRDSRTAAGVEPLAHQVRQLESVLARAADFDVFHFHTGYLHFPLLRRTELPAVTTLHGALNVTDHRPLFEEYDDVALVSISNTQRAPVPNANFRATIQHGMPLDLHRFDARGGDYLAFVGHASPQEGLDRAIQVAVRSGTKLKVAARICADERTYYHEVIAPLLREAGPLVEFLGELEDAAKDELLRGARALLFPIDWEEPFGLVMIESLATGTPVVAWGRGSVPEVIDDGRTGFIVDSIDDALSVLPALGRIDRRRCRAAFERRFGVERMATDYVALYRTLGERRSGPRISAGREASGAPLELRMTAS
jgi:glycosyltransferase involved in cell wall biosynthesis